MSRYDSVNTVAYEGASIPMDLRDRRYRCAPDTHFFDCRHEVTCECGEVIRRSEVEKVVAEGL
jgi:hypothetical protein